MKRSDVERFIDKRFGLSTYFERVMDKASCGEKQIEYMFRIVEPVFVQVKRVIVTQKPVISYSLNGLFAVGDRTLDLFGAGHVLLDDMPGKGKTLFGMIPAIVLGGTFTRFQGAVDKLPSDYTGNRVRVQDKKGRGHYHMVKGPAFGNFQLIDEANRNTEKTQGAFLETLAEGKVTIFDETHKLEHPPWAILTQNPIETEGVFPLIDALADRIMFKIRGVRFTARDFAEIDERTTLFDKLRGELVQICGVETVREVREFFLKEIYIDPDLREKTMGQFAEVSNDPHRFGFLQNLADEFQGPIILNCLQGRGFPHWVSAAKTLAAFRYRNYVIADDALKVLLPILRHRVKFAGGAIDFIHDLWSRKDERWKRQSKDDVIDAVIQQLIQEAW